MVQNHIKGPFDPKYVGDYHVVSIKGNQDGIRPSIGGPTEMKHVKYVKYVLLADQYIKHVPDYSTFGRKATLRMNPKQIPDLHWQIADTYHTTNIGQSTLHMSTPKYNNTYEINLHINTTTIDGNVDTIVCSISNKT